MLIKIENKNSNMSSVVSDHETMEYKSNYGLGEINASDAYARVGQVKVQF